MYYWATQQVPLVEQDLLPIERNIDYPHFLFKLISFECCIGIFCLNCHDLKGPCNTLRGLVFCNHCHTYTYMPTTVTIAVSHRNCCCFYHYFRFNNYLMWWILCRFFWYCGQRNIRWYPWIQSPARSTLSGLFDWFRWRFWRWCWYTIAFIFWSNL